MWCKLTSPVLHFQFTQKPSGDVTENLAERELERETEREREGRGSRERWDEGRRKQRRERVRKSSALLQDMKKTSEKKEREYRGIVNNRAAGVYTHRVFCVLLCDLFFEEYERAIARSSSAGCDGQQRGNLNTTTPSNGRPHPLATTSSGKHTGGVSSKSSVDPSLTVKQKTKSSSSKTSGHDSTTKNKKSSSPVPNNKSLTTTKQPNSAASLKKPSTPGSVSKTKTHHHQQQQQRHLREQHSL